jgi:hypothetical protein
MRCSIPPNPAFTRACDKDDDRPFPRLCCRPFKKTQIASMHITKLAKVFYLAPFALKTAILLEMTNWRVDQTALGHLTRP